MADNIQAGCEPRPAGRPLPGIRAPVSSGSHWTGCVNGRRRSQRALSASGTACCGGGFALWRIDLAFALAVSARRAPPHREAALPLSMASDQLDEVRLEP